MVLTLSVALAAASDPGPWGQFGFLVVVEDVRHFLVLTKYGQHKHGQHKQ